MEQMLLGWLTRYGAPVLFFAQIFGIVGLPVPDELLLMVAGALIHRGLLHVSSTSVATVAGCLGGITISYLLGRLVGLPILRTRLHLPDRSVLRAQMWFRRFGTWLLAFGYFIPGIRHVTAIAAGSTPLDYPTFARYAYPGGVLWCSTFLGLGYVAGDRWRSVAEASRANVMLIALIIGSLFAVYVSVKAITARREP